MRISDDIRQMLGNVPVITQINDDTGKRVLTGSEELMRIRI